MKKALSLVLAAAMLLAVLAGCGGKVEPSAPPANTAAPTQAATPANTAEPTQEVTERTPHKIAVAFYAITNAELEQKAYLENYVGPAFNVEFMFSEAIADTEAFMTFIENAYAAGCEGIMNFQSDAAEQGAAKAEELGMYMITNTNRIPESVAGLQYNMGCIGTSVPGVAALFGDAVRYLTSDGEPHNVAIISGGASLGNNQHRETTVAILETLQDIYDLTYSQEIIDIATSKAQTEVDTGTDMKIFIYPGYAGSDTYVPGFSSVLQTGDYDIVLSTYAVYTQFSVAIDEVERAFDMDIKLATIASVGEAAKNAYDTKDVKGNPSLDIAIIRPNCVLVGAMFALLYNALEGNADAVRKDGLPSQYHMLNWICFGAEGYATLEELDVMPDTYALQIADIEGLLVSGNPSVNFDSLYSTFNSITADSVAAARGK